MYRQTLRLSLSLLPIVLSGCSAYVPILHPTPAITGAGQVEMAAAVSANNAVTGSVTYSPAKHVLVQGGGSLGFTMHDTPDAIHRQGEVALGYYQQFRPEGLHWTALAGYSRTYSRRTFVNFDSSPFLPFLPLPVGTATYRTFYNRRFVQLGVHNYNAAKTFTYGMSARAVRVDFDRPSIDGQRVGQKPVHYIEPLFFVRYGPRPQSALQAQLQVGNSVALLDKSTPLPARRLYRGSLFINAGFIFHPDFLFRHPEVVPGS